MIYSLNIPTKINIGTINDLKSYLIEQMSDRKILLFISNSMEKRFNLQETLEYIEKNNKVNRINKINANPTVADIKNTIDMINLDYDCVIAIGGGSTIDLAKAIVALDYMRREIQITSKDIVETITNKKYIKYQKRIEFIAIPTTAGTGSEVTQWATIWRTDDTTKMSVEAPWLAPTLTFIIPELTLGLSAKLTLSTGLDALSHATESYWSKQSSLLSRELSKVAIQHIVNNLPKVLNQPDNLDYRTEMCIGSVFAGVAFAQTRTTACHSISYPLTMMYGIEHGFAAAITLIAVMKINQNNIYKFNDLINAYGVDTIEELHNWMDMLCNDIQPLKLEAFHVKKEDIVEIAKNSFSPERMENNPVKLDINDVISILEQSF